MAIVLSHEECSVSPLVQDSLVGTRFDEQLDHRRAAILSSRRQCRVPILRTRAGESGGRGSRAGFGASPSHLGGQILLGARLEEHVDHWRVAMLRRNIQWRGSFVLQTKNTSTKKINNAMNKK